MIQSRTEGSGVPRSFPAVNWPNTSSNHPLDTAQLGVAVLLPGRCHVRSVRPRSPSCFFSRRRIRKFRERGAPSVLGRIYLVRLAHKACLKELGPPEFPLSPTAPTAWPDPRVPHRETKGSSLLVRAYLHHPTDPSLLLRSMSGERPQHRHALVYRSLAYSSRRLRTAAVRFEWKPGGEEPASSRAPKRGPADRIP